MVSIVVCHRNPTLLYQLEQSISETIGIPYEMVIIDNSTNEYNIFQAYNRGVKLSKFDLICFVHEDLIFHTKNWGINILDHFKDEKTGIIGAAGGSAFPRCPAMWWHDSPTNDRYINIIQPRYVKSANPEIGEINNFKSVATHDYFNPTNEKRAKVVTIDGVFICIRKKVFVTCRFDEKAFNGFHCYDLDICFQIIQSYNAYVIFDVLIEHFSFGTINETWVESIEKLVNKWRDKLPVFTKKVSRKEFNLYGLKCLNHYCEFLFSLGYSYKKITQVIRSYHTFLPIQWGDREYLELSLCFIFGTRQVKLTKGYFHKIKSIL